MSLKDDWKKAKTAFETAIKKTAQKDSLKKLAKGADFGAALEKFDKAKTFDEKQAALRAVLKAKTTYEGLLDKAEKDADPEQKEAIKDLRKALLQIWKDVQDEAQPVRPSGSMVKYELLRSFNLASGIKVKYLDVTATQVDAYVEIDAALDKLIKEGKESLKIDHLGSVAKAELEKVRGAFTSTMQYIDIEMVVLTQQGNWSKRDANVKVANEVLKHYAKIVEDRTNAAVQAEWQKYLARQKHLKDFKVKSGAKIALGTVGVGVAVASAALSFGALWMNVFAAAKGVLDVAVAIKTLAEGMDTTYERLIADIQKVDDLNRLREEAKKKGGWAVASKSAQAAKELANQLLPFTKALTASANTVGERAQQFLGQTSKLEDKANDWVGTLNKATQALSKLPEKDVPPKLEKLATEMGDTYKQLFQETTDLHQRAMRAAAFGERALKAVEKLKTEDSWSLGVPEQTKWGSRLAAAYSAANFAFECAMNGKALIPM